MDFTPTPSQTVGPYFHVGCIDQHAVNCIADRDAQGERIHLTCQVLDGEGIPVNDAMLEIWQADAAGRYNHPLDEQRDKFDSHCRGFGRMATNENGICIFETIKPGRVAANGEKLQAPHLNVSVFARGILKHLVTRIYFASEPANDECPVLSVVPPERRPTLLAQPETGNSNNWRFVIHLCGKDETVFFDV
jgi:protocatechuate 3,4-dioxygenase, alpha subunit